MVIDVPQFPRIVDCFPPLKELPGCCVKQIEEFRGSSLSYDVNESASSSLHSTSSLFPSVVTPSPLPSPADEEGIAIPSGMPASTKQTDLPSIPPPKKYWKLKKLDPTANVMDYWIKSSQEWDIDGIESDIAVSLAAES
jgi:hypothetical protein